ARAARAEPAARAGAEAVDRSSAPEVVSTATGSAPRPAAEPDAAAEAARFAAATASFVVEAYGVAGAPSRAQVEARLAAHPEIRLQRL
ncbi:MAG TPA: hypothetical protein VFD32_10305, partial [Dehalococcoidia bacterium]|nr:hypothetical protein [Dehalococcoidia bacterium]